MISDIPWGGPVGAVACGRVNGEFVINPTFAEIETSDLDLRIAGTRDAILMVECGANEIPEDVMVAALELGHKVHAAADRSAIPDAGGSGQTETRTHA